MIKTIMLLSLSVFFASTPSNAVTFSDFFKNTVKTFFSNVDVQTANRLGIDINNLDTEIDKVELLLFQSGFISGSGNAARTGGVSTKNKIIFNSLTLERVLTSKYRNTFLVHEYLTSKNIMDEHYQISILLLLIKQQESMKNTSKLPLLVDHIFENLKQKESHLYAFADGSVTAVGSGGDHVSLELKYECVKYFIENNYSLSKIIKLLEAQFESNYSTKNNTIAGKSILTVGKQKNIKIMLPSFYYEFYGQEAKEKVFKDLLKQIKSKI